jgi:hypothetical protein
MSDKVLPSSIHFGAAALAVHAPLMVLLESGAATSEQILEAVDQAALNLSTHETEASAVLEYLHEIMHQDEVRERDV